MTRKSRCTESDIRFCRIYATQKERRWKVTKLSIVIFDKQEYDGKPAVKTITYGSSDILSFRMATKLTDANTQDCHVSYTNTDKETDH